MKQHLITIAALVLVGCSKPPPPDISIHEAAFTGNIKAVKQHITSGTDVNVKGNGGYTPLVSARTKEMAELLIANGADVNAKDPDGETPLDMSINRKHTSITDLLRKHGGKTGEELKAEGK